MRILGILPESIGGRLTISSIFDGFKMLGADVVIYDKLSPTVISDFIFNYIVSYDFTGIKFKVANNLVIKTINYFSIPEIQSQILYHLNHDYIQNRHYYSN